MQPNAWLLKIVKKSHPTNHCQVNWNWQEFPTETRISCEDESILMNLTPSVLIPFRRNVTDTLHVFSTHLKLMFNFYTRRKHQKTSGFLIFLGGKEVEHWPEMIQGVVIWEVLSRLAGTGRFNSILLWCSFLWNYVKIIRKKNHPSLVGSCLHEDWIPLKQEMCY